MMIGMGLFWVAVIVGIVWFVRDGVDAAATAAGDPADDPRPQLRRGRRLARRLPPTQKRPHQRSGATP
jgi:hypothetical protein